MKKDLNYWTRKEFESLPERDWREDIGEFDSLIILPTKNTHDSGFKCMDFVAVIDETPKCRLSGGSDVVHLNGICGLGENWLSRFGGMPEKVVPISWSIDCLKKSNLLRLFCGKKLKAGDALSSFELFVIEEKSKEPKDQ